MCSPISTPMIVGFEQNPCKLRVRSLPFSVDVRALNLLVRNVLVEVSCCVWNSTCNCDRNRDLNQKQTSRQTPRIIGSHLR